MRVLITGGAGFVGSSIAQMLRRDHSWEVVALDNLRRRGSELALRRLADSGVHFIHGDIRNLDDLDSAGPADLIVDCCAEPSVHAGGGTDARYVVDTNLLGTFNCLEHARRHRSALIFLSTSRVYSIDALRGLPLVATSSRFKLTEYSSGVGWSSRGLSEAFPTTGHRSLYGSTKLASELLIEEYRAMHGIAAIINRCGVITGPWQMGKVDQGFFVLWAARHLYGGDLSYNGFDGLGLQVRDVLHIDDLYRLIACEIRNLETFAGRVFNVGGGPEASISLSELTKLCAQATKEKVAISSKPDTSAVDVPFYVSDNSLVTAQTGWKPERTIENVLEDVLEWLDKNRGELLPIFRPQGAFQ